MILEEEHVCANHAVDVLHVYQRIMTIAWAGIKRREFPEDTPVRASIDVILA